MAQKDESDAKGRLQGTILKKCDRSNHHPDDSKACGARERGEQRGACQHTCEPSEVDTCRHAWTYRYSVPGGKQREESFPDELYDDGRPRLNSGKRKAQDRQLVLSIGKREQGRSFSDPRAGEEPFMQAAEEMIRTSTRIRSPLGSGSRDIYLRVLRGDIKKAFTGKTLAQMATSAAADDVSTFLNVTIAHRCKSQRAHARMIFTWTMDAAVKAGKVTNHKLIGITVDKGTAKTRRQRAAEEAEDDDAMPAGGFVFLTDDQVRVIAEGMKTVVIDTRGRVQNRTHPGIGMAAWLCRCMGLRINEALGVERADFRTRKDGSHYLRLRAQASRNGRERVPLKHRPAGEGRDVEVPDMIWDMVEPMPDGPLCPGPCKSRYMRYDNARYRIKALCERLEVTGFTSHMLRHQFASETLETLTVGNIALLAEILGHLSAETTLQVYVHATPGARERMREMMNTRWSQPAGEAPAQADEPAPAGETPAQELATLRAENAALRAQLAQPTQLPHAA